MHKLAQLHLHVRDGTGALSLDILSCKWNTLGKSSGRFSAVNGRVAPATIQRVFVPEMSNFDCWRVESTEDGVAIVVGVRQRGGEYIKLVWCTSGEDSRT